MVVENQKDLYLVRGVPGSGKTTFVKSLQKDGDVVVCGDDFMVNDKGEYVFDWRRLDEVARRCREAVSLAMEKRVPRIFVHNTLTKAEYLDPYFKMAKKHDYRVFSLVMENYHKGESEHRTPQKTLEKYRKEFEISL